MSASPDNDDLLLGRRAVELGLITPKQLSDALAEQSRQVDEGQEAPSLGSVLVARKLVPEAKLVSLLWEDEIQKSDAEIRDFLSSFDAPKVKQGGPPTRRMSVVQPEDKAGRPFGPYRLVREVGRGGMAVVYEAVDQAHGRRCALKMLLASSRINPEEAALDEERFLREARLSAKLPKHPHVVSVEDTGVVDGKRYIAMEFIEGREMAEWWRKSYASTRMQVRVLRDVALAVHHAHQHGVIHRDLKPANILIDTRNQPHVTDFGLARGLRKAGEESLTMEDRVVGTPTYMSPEQAEGRKSVDRRSDVYSLGVLLYEILAGRPPFRGETAMEIMVKVARDPVPPPSTSFKKGLRSPPDKELEAICMRALTKKPADRIPTAKAFADALSGWLREKGGGGVGLAAYKAFALTGIAAGAVALLLLVLVLMGVFSSSPVPVPPRPIKPSEVAGPVPPPPPVPTLAAQALEGEALKGVVVTHGKTRVQTLAGCSGGAQLFWTGGRPQSAMRIPLEAPAEGRATLLLSLTKAQDYGIVRLSLNGERISEDLDLYQPKIETGRIYRFKGMPLKKGRNEIEIKIVGTNSKATPTSADSDLFQLGVDRLELQP